MQLQVFQYEDDDSLDDLNIVEINGNAWFIAAEVCNLLDISNPTQALTSLDEDEKLPYVLHRAGQKRQVNLISESGLYSIIFKSKKPSAKRFQRWITQEVIPSIRKTGSYNQNYAPNFVQRFNDNYDRINAGHFSVISELFIRLYGRFERAGYTIPDKAFSGKEIRPDVSVGQRFSNHLKKSHPQHAKNFIMYWHKFPDGNEFEARQYPNALLPIFIEFVDNVWIPEIAHEYFRVRDAIALDYLPLLLTKK